MDNTIKATPLHAPIYKRIAALLIDSTICLAVGVGIAALLDVSIFNPLFLTILNIFFWLFKSMFESKFDTTPGKTLTKIQVISAENGGSIKFFASAMRNSWLLLELIPFIGSILSLSVMILLLASCLKQRDSVGLHDQYTDAIVISKR